MANRFLDTNYYRSPFVRSLSPELKSFYSFVICDCTASGIWFLDFDAVKLYTGFDLNYETFEKNFIKKRKAIKIADGKYFFPDFIEHQYPGGLSDNNKAHKNILIELRKFNLLNEQNFPKKEAPLEESLKEPIKDPLQGVQGIGNGNGQGLGNGNLFSEKKFNKRPTSVECDLELPHNYVKQAIEYLDINKQIKKSEGQIMVMWETFKLENFDGSSFYENENKVFTHFLRAIKNEKNGQPTNSASNKSNSKVDALKQW